MPKGHYKNRVRPTPACGTISGHTTHRKRNEAPCGACIRANSEYKRAYREANALHIAAKLKEYRATNKETASAYAKTWAKNNRDKKNGYERKRRAFRYAVEHSPYYSTEVIEVYGEECHLCGEPIDLTAPRQSGITGWEKGLHLDHLIPISSGGSDTIDNIRPAHGFCNVSKGNKDKENEK